METEGVDLATPLGADVRRLHPWTLLQRFVISIPGFIILLLPVLRSPSSTNWLNLGIAAVYGAVTLPLIYLQYYRFRYWITSSELVIHSGVFTRRRRNIPVERIQNIDIERKLLPRLLGTASIKVFTAGSATAEGVLEYVSVSEANRIRQVIRSYQRDKDQHHSPGRISLPDAPPSGKHNVPPNGPGEFSQASTDVRSSLSDAGADAEESVKPLVTMGFERVLLSGVFRFSLLYIAIIFSFLQFIEPDPEQLADLLTRGRFRGLIQSVTESPWLTAVVAIAAAAALSWLSGIAVNVNKYYGFRLWKEKDKLHKRHGLLTLSETTIPLKKIQALICRSNPVMDRLGWWALEVQTMGLNVREQGHQVAAPFSQESEIGPLTEDILPIDWPRTLQRVSRRTIRRITVRYSVSLLVISALAATVWKPALYALLLLTVVPIWAWLSYRNHGYALTNDGLVIRKGVIKRMIWFIPVEKMHVFYRAQSIFQRRLGLATVYVDTAGASTIHFPTIVDLPSAAADALTDTMYSRFKQLARQAGQKITPREDSIGPGTEPQESSFALPVPAGR